MQNSASPYEELPEYPTIGEIVAEVGNVARENLAKITPPQGKPAPKPAG